MIALRWRRGNLQVEDYLIDVKVVFMDSRRTTTLRLLTSSSLGTPIRSVSGIITCEAVPLLSEKLLPFC